MGAKPLLKNV